MVSWLDTIKGHLAGAWLNFETYIISPIFPPKTPPCVESADLHGKRVLVSGANSGLGREMAHYFAAHGAEVFLLCRELDCSHEPAASDVRDDIIKKTGNTNVYVETLDMSVLDSVRGFARRWGARSQDERRIDILMNNAGMFGTVRKTMTADGLEPTYQVNVLGHFLLTTSLLNLSCFAHDARIIQTSSVAMYGSSPLDPSDPNASDMLGKYSQGEQLPFTTQIPMDLYSRSKAALVILTRELHARLAKTEKWKDVVVQCCHPGVITTGLWKDPKALGGHVAESRVATFVWKLIHKLSISPSQGIATPLYLATSSEVTQRDVRGKYWAYGRWRWTPGWMEDAQRRQAMWDRWEADAGVEANF